MLCFKINICERGIDMLDRIRNVLEEYIDIPKDQITMETNLLNDLGFSSLDLVNIVVAFEEEFDIEIPDRKISKIVTVGDVAEILKQDFGIF